MLRQREALSDLLATPWSEGMPPVWHSFISSVLHSYDAGQFYSDRRLSRCDYLADAAACLSSGHGWVGHPTGCEEVCGGDCPFTAGQDSHRSGQDVERVRVSVGTPPLGPAVATENLDRHRSGVCV